MGLSLAQDWVWTHSLSTCGLSVAPLQLLPWTSRSDDVDAQLQQQLASLQAVSAQAEAEAAEEEEEPYAAAEIARKVLLHGFPGAQGPPPCVSRAPAELSQSSPAEASEQGVVEAEGEVEDGVGGGGETSEASTEQLQARAEEAAAKAAEAAEAVRRWTEARQVEETRRASACDALLAALHAPTATSLGDRLVGLPLRKVCAPPLPLYQLGKANRRVVPTHYALSREPPPSVEQPFVACAVCYHSPWAAASVFGSSPHCATRWCRWCCTSWTRPRACPCWRWRTACTTLPGSTRCAPPRVRWRCGASATSTSTPPPTAPRSPRCP